MRNHGFPVDNPTFVTIAGGAVVMVGVMKLPLIVYVDVDDTFVRSFGR